MLIGNISRKVRKLSRNKSCAELKLIEYLTTEGVCLGVAGNRLCACGELDNGVAVIRLAEDHLLRAVGVLDTLLCKNESEQIIGYLTVHLWNIAHATQEKNLS